jgi:hypothetical protein
MKPHLLAVVAAAALASVASAASAADNQPMSNASAPKTMSKTMSKTSPMPAQAMAKDIISLTRAQERTAWRDISREATSQKMPQNFAASVGTTVPADISLQSVPAKVATHVAALKPYDYALLHGKLLIVNPTDKKVVDVINRRA